MSYAARILADNLAPSDYRLTTFEITFPRIVLAEFNTHRQFSRNSASSRAIPISKMIERVEQDPFVPTYWGKNQKGMQADEELTDHAKIEAMARWLMAKDAAVEQVKALMEIGVHKQLGNRLLEPFMWQTVLVTSTDYENFFKLRCHKDAQPEIREIAVRMEQLYRENRPLRVGTHFWHMPLMEDAAQLLDAGYNVDQLRDISAGRCARVSYLTHDGKRDPEADLALAKRLIVDGHMSPFEHIACASGLPVRSRNFNGWFQYREMKESV